MACREITSPITGKTITSKTWNDIRSLVQSDQAADEAYMKLTSPEFISWFGDWINSPSEASKVVTEDGEPLVVYHGTDYNFDTFFTSLSDKGENTGIFFSDERNYAKYWANTRLEESRDRYSTSINGTYYVENVNTGEKERFDSYFDEKVYPVFLNIRNLAKATQSIERLQTYIERNGADGIVGKDFEKEDKSGNVYVVFEPNQIKSINNQGTFSSDTGNIYQQKENSIPSKASPKTVALVKEFLKRAGVNVQSLEHIIVNGEKIGANGLANPIQALIQVVNGKEDTALPEEAMHIAVAIIKENNPALYEQMLNRIGSYNIYDQVFHIYKDDKEYMKEGKPDIRKIKEEAVAKLLVEHIINQSENITEKPELLAQAQTWWQKIMSFIKGIFNKAGFNPFEETARKIVQGEDIGSAKDVKEEGVFLQKNDDVYNKIQDEAKKITKTADGYEVGGKKVKHRVTELAKAFYERTFGNSEITKSELQKATDDIKKEKGTKGHADIENAFHTLVDDNGLLRAQALNDSGYVSQMDPNDNSIYKTLKKNLTERLNSFPAGTKFISEVPVYDSKRDEAGTIDLLALTPDGKVNILDWKFISINTDRSTDVPWYKVRAWRIQIGEYKRILKDVYGVKAEDFEQTRAIPILAQYTKEKGKPPVLDGIRIGDVNVKAEQNDYLLPVGLEEETTGNKKLDTLLGKLNKVYDTISDTKVPEEERANKKEQLNTLFTAMRQLQIKQNLQPLLKQAKTLNKEISSFIKDYRDNIQKKDSKSFTNKELSDLADRADNYTRFIDTYTNIDTQLKDLIDLDNKELREEVRDAAADARELKSILSDAEQLDGIQEQIATKIAERREIDSVLTPERIVKGIQAWFNSTSEIPIKTLQAIFKTRREAKQLTDFEVSEENEKLANVKKGYDGWAKSKGKSDKNYFDIIKKKDSNELIDEYNKDFYKDLKSKIADNEVKWIKDNIDVTAFKQAMADKLQEELDRIDAKTDYLGTDEEVAQQINIAKNKAKIAYDVSNDKGAGWYNYDVAKKFPVRDKWETKEWKELHKAENKPALDFYNYIVERNTYYKSVGYISPKYARVFLPYVPKTFMEKMVLGGKVTLGESLLRGMSIDEGTVGYGSYDPLTGQIVNSIPKYFTSKFEGDYSTDLFHTMGLYNEAAIRYKYLSDVEGQIRALNRLERNKKAIQTSYFGKIQKDTHTGQLKYVSNEQNASLVEQMSNALIYDRKFVDDAGFDQLLGKVGDWGEKINKKLGTKIFPENIGHRQFSLNKSIDTLNRVFQQKILGINILSSISNYLGGNFQAFINAGKYFTKTDFIKSESQLYVSRLSGEQGRKIFASFEYFMPFTENHNRKVLKDLSLSKLSQENIQDRLMGMMRFSDWVVQASIFTSMLNNSIVHNGEIVNAREFLSKQAEYKNRYNLSSEQRKALEKKLEQDVKKLIDEKGVLKLSSIDKDGKLSIPGIDRNSQSVYTLRQNTQHLSKDALGNMTEDEVRKIQLNVFGKSFMVFKNWIPRLVDVRVGGLKYNSASDAYEWGRFRTMYHYLSFNVIKSIRDLHDTLVANQRGVSHMRELFEQKQKDYEETTGSKLNMTEDEFFDLVRQNIKSQMRDLLFYTALMGLYFGYTAHKPEKDDDPASKNYHNFVSRALDKFSDEVGFFYNPFSIQQILNGSVFPSMGMFTDAALLLQNFGKDVYGLGTGNEDVYKSAHSIKYLMKNFPITNQMTSYLPLLYPDMAKELGLHVSAQSRLH